MKHLSYAFVALLLCSVGAFAQTSAFTYQGHLNDSGDPANGNYDMVFTLHDTATQTNQLGGTINLVPVAVSNGLFTVTLGYGTSVFNGSNRWLQIAVRGYGDTNAYIVLSNRQQITSAPYSIQALNAGNAVLATTLTTPLPATNISGTIPDAKLSTNVAFLNSNVFFKASVSATQFNGSGAGLTNLPATNLTGTIPDARLSPNVAMKGGSVNFNGTVAATNFFGYGGGLTNVPGRLFDNDPIGSATQALANTGYLTTNDTSAVILTLPLSADIRVGETIRVAASGAGGWRIAQNSGQSVLVANLSDSIGLVWTPSDSVRDWQAVASSIDGRRMLAVVDPGGAGGLVYTSTNSGTSWTSQPAGTRHWSAVASSGDGTKLVATVNGGQIYTSVDSWGAHGLNQSWVSVASSLDGVNLVAAANPGGAGGQIYTSVNSGSTWGVLASAGTRTWSAVASSANGQFLVATVQGGNIFTSTNGGANWRSNVVAFKGWTSVASSQDGSKLVASASSAQNYISADFGATWTPTGPTGLWTSVASSADGSRLAGVMSAGAIYLSLDSGSSWSQAAGAPSNLGWTGVAISGDGSSVVAVPIANQIYVSSQSTTTVGTAGYLTGTRLSAIDLMYVGNNQFMPVTQMGTIRAH